MKKTMENSIKFVSVSAVHGRCDRREANLYAVDTEGRVWSYCDHVEVGWVLLPSPEIETKQT